MIDRCAQCDAGLEPYGRGGGHSWCRKCREEQVSSTEINRARDFVGVVDRLLGQAA